MKVAPSSQKLRGGYYTPPPICEFLAGWAIRSASDRVLEPSCGNGAFLTASCRRLLKLAAGSNAELQAHQIFGVEIDKTEAAIARKAVQDLLPTRSADVLAKDFFSACSDELLGRKFDVVLGNPPFIRYQNFPEPGRSASLELMRKSGYSPSKLTNAWLPFLAVSLELLSDSGRLAMVVPAELLQVTYAAELRAELAKRLIRLVIVTFRRLVFEDIQQEVVLLLAEKHPTLTPGIHVLQLEDADDLAMIGNQVLTKEEPKPLDHGSDKWTQYFLDSSEIRLLRRIVTDHGLPRVGDIAEVDVGVVTGLNEVFVLSDEQVRSYSAERFVIPLVGRSGHLSGLRFDPADWQLNRDLGRPSFLLNLPAVPVQELPKALRGYLAEAERRNLHKGYKCSIRTPWYSVPSIWCPDGFMLRQISDRALVFSNPAKAICTDTIHRVKMRKGFEIDAFAACFSNCLTAVQAEVFGRSYGGGVLELEPREAEHLCIPYSPDARARLIELDKVARELGAEQVAKVVDEEILHKTFHFSERTIVALRRMRAKLRDRRSDRKHRSSVADHPLPLFAKCGRRQVVNS